MRAGTASNVRAEELETLPTVSRSLADFARLNPNFVTTSQGSGRRPSCQSPAATIAITTSRSTVRSTTTCSRFPRQALQAAPQRRSRSASMPSRSSNSSSRRTTCGRAASRGAASTRSPVAARTSCTRTAYYFGRDDSLVGKISDGGIRIPLGPFSDKQVRRKRERKNSRRTRRSSSATSILADATPRLDSRSEARVRIGGIEPRRSDFVDILKNRYGYDPGAGGDALARIRAYDGQQQSVRQNRLQPEQQASPDCSTQLHRCSQRHRAFRRTSCTTSQTTSIGSATIRIRRCRN